MRSVLGLLLLVLVSVTVCSAATPDYPGYNRLIIPKTARVIVPDGVIGADEWSDAAVVTGLSRCDSHDLLPQEQQTWFYLTYDDHYLYMAMHSLNFPVGMGLKTDCKNAVDSTSKRSTETLPDYDHYEFQFSPSPNPSDALYKYYYKIAGNHRDSLLDMLSHPSIGNWGFRWNSGAKFGNKVTDTSWDTEVAIPFTYLDGAPPADFDTWLMWLMRAYNGKQSDAFAFLWGGDAWNGWEKPQRTPVETPRVTFASSCVSARLEKLGEPLAGNIDAVLALKNHSTTSQTVNVGLVVADPSKVSAREQVYSFEDAITLEPGVEKRVSIRKPDLVVRNGETLTITVWMDSSAGSGARQLGPTVIYQQRVGLVPKTADYMAKNIEQVKEYREKWLNYAWKAAYYASNGAVHARLDLDVDGIEPKFDKAAKWRFQIAMKGTKPGFEKTVPVANKHADIDTGPQDKLPEGSYLVESILLDKSGKELDTNSYPLEIKKQPWEGCRAGIDDDFVPPPYVPLKAEGDTLAMLNRTYKLADTGLPASMVSEGHELLASPVRLEAIQDGRRLDANGTGIKWGAMHRGSVRWTASGRIGALAFTQRNRLEYDGTIFVDLTLDPGKTPFKLDSLDLIMDMGGLVDVIRPYDSRANPFMFPASQQGTIWESAKSWPIEDMKGTFNPTLYLGNPDRGIWWFANSDKGWFLDDNKSATTVERIPDGAVRMNQWLVNTPSTIAKPVTISFMLQAVPAKPLPTGWREVAWGKDRIYGGSGWSQGYYDFSFNTPEQWRQFSKWNWASNPLYTATILIGQSVPGFPTYAGEWMGDSDYDKLKVNPDVEKWGPPGVWKTTFGLEFTENYKRRVGSFVWVDMVPSQIDCRLYYYEQGVKYGGLRGFWWDMESLWSFYKPDLGLGYTRKDGHHQPEFNFTYMRELLKRMYNTAYINGAEPENWHYSTGIYGSYLYGVWLTEGPFYMTGEKVDLVSGANKDVWPIVSGRYLGSIPYMRSNFYTYKLDQPMADPAPARAALMLCLLNDFSGEGFNDWYRDIVERLLRAEGFFDPDVRSICHWDPEVSSVVGCAAADPNADVRTTVYVLANRRLLLVIGNMGESGTKGTVTITPRSLLGIDTDCRNLAVKNLESGISLPMSGQPAEQMTLRNVFVGPHDFRLLLISAK